MVLRFGRVIKCVGIKISYFGQGISILSGDLRSYLTLRLGNSICLFRE